MLSNFLLHLETCALVSHPQSSFPRGGLAVLAGKKKSVKNRVHVRDVHEVNDKKEQIRSPMLFFLFFTLVVCPSSTQQDQGGI